MFGIIHTIVDDEEAVAMVSWCTVQVIIMIVMPMLYMYALSINSAVLLT